MSPPAAERASGAAQDHDAHFLVAPELLESSRSRSRAGMVTRFSFSGTSSVIVATPTVVVAVDPQSVHLGHAFTS